eukprot:CAMPEP_0196673322 /NCGR_PEP_ID=MMETSP1090-20130531/2883_1 /TAXON_ID=37098 /ORGANISM="Isochrysis sp, Strain CCMP1244" /LENGTH=382 /DNA_ID=CAMNT_0042011079 /DNA_START=1 /DNA_END=1149 /DNA_ORIENTATION=+
MVLSGSITFLYSSRLADARRFYSHDLGLPLRRDGGVLFFALPGGAASLGIVPEGTSAAASPPVSAVTAGRDTAMVCLLTDDVDGTFAKALAGGRCSAEQPPRATERFGIYNALLRDPDGYLVELQRFTDAAEQREFCGGSAASEAASDQAAAAAAEAAKAAVEESAVATAEVAKAPLVVAVGSKNPVKVNAVRAGFAAAFPLTALEVVAYDVPSGVSDQPWGEAETRQGALNRAENCLGAHCLGHGGAMPDFAVGVEGGVAECSLSSLHPGTPGLDSCTECFAFLAVMRSPASEAGVAWGVARTGSFALPPRLAALVKSGVELGDADDRVFGDSGSKRKGGTVGKLTRGLVDRTAYYEHAMHLALAPFVHGEEFPGLYDAGE